MDKKLTELTLNARSLIKWLPAGEHWEDLVERGQCSPATVADYVDTLNAIALNIAARGGMPEYDAIDDEPDFSLANLHQWGEFMKRHG